MSYLLSLDQFTTVQKLAYAQLARNRANGLSDWSPESQALFDIIRTEVLEFKED